MGTYILPTSSPAPYAHFVQTVVQYGLKLSFQFPGQRESAPSATGQRMGAVNILRLSSKGTRHAALLRQSILVNRSAYFIVATPIESTFSLSYGGVETHAPPDSFVILPNSKPFHASISKAGSRNECTALYARVPAALLRDRVPGIDAICGQFFKISRGASHAMRNAFITALDDGPLMKEECANSYGQMAFDLICAASSEILGVQVGDTGLRACTNTMLILEKARNFIQANIFDPDLTCDMVADHCRISTRYLHTIFTSDPQGVSCSSYIRELRLQRCREALRSPELRHRNVGDIAADWGFVNHAAFTNLYKSHFGKAPSCDRT